MAAEKEEWEEWARFMGILQDKWERETDKSKVSFHQVHTEALAEFEATPDKTGILVDEFEIKATGHASSPDRIWTRSRLATAQNIADQAIRSLGYGKAIVVNTFGGHRSDALYTVEGLRLTEGG